MIGGIAGSYHFVVIEMFASKPIELLQSLNVYFLSRLTRCPTMAADRQKINYLPEALKRKLGC
jgi:hypothetical protein